MKPILSALKRVRLLSDIPEMDSPATKTSPPSNSSRPERQFKSVVLPHPEGPITASISPREMLKSTPLKAWTIAPPAVYVLSKSWASTIVLLADFKVVFTFASSNIAYGLLFTRLSLHQRVYGRSV